ncbi:MAG TPA: hypothetical protein VHC97_21390 [Thermoanaerobaculia bacterium]|nr:hypothetical protein [Thermoanaerobaculia bacterium]
MIFRATLWLMAGAVVLHLVLTVLDFAGVPWNPLPLAALGVILCGLAWRLLPRERTRFPSDWGWGDGLALFALVAFTLVALTGWIATPDFVYHWGIKGHRFYLHRGVDYGWLARRWNWVLHPDYPNLLPELFAVTAWMTGGFHVPAMMLVTAAVFALLLAAVREGLRQGGAGRFTRQAGLALVALACGAFGMASLLPGGADGMIALALAAALPPLLRPPDSSPDYGGDLQIGVIAAFAAASKMEGLPLAAFLVLVQWGRRVLSERRPALGAALRTGLPPALVALPWLARTVRHHLFLELNSGSFNPSRAGVIFATVGEVLRAPSWHGFLLAAFLPPLLLWHRRTRPFATVATLQLLFYFHVYFSTLAAEQTRAYILSNFARLGFHLIPASLAAALVVWRGGDEKGGDKPRPLGTAGTEDQRAITEAA